MRKPSWLHLVDPTYNVKAWNFKYTYGVDLKALEEIYTGIDLITPMVKGFNIMVASSCFTQVPMRTGRFNWTYVGLFVVIAILVILDTYYPPPNPDGAYLPTTDTMLYHYETTVEEQARILRQISNENNNIYSIIEPSFDFTGYAIPFLLLFCVLLKLLSKKNKKKWFSL